MGTPVEVIPGDFFCGGHIFPGWQTDNGEGRG